MTEIPRQQMERNQVSDDQGVTEAEHVVKGASQLEIDRGGLIMFFTIDSELYSCPSSI